MAPYPGDRSDAPPGPARERRETPGDLPPRAAIDAPGRLGLTQTLLLAVAAAIVLALALAVLG